MFSSAFYVDKKDMIFLKNLVNIKDIEDLKFLYSKFILLRTIL